jgi:hypothetical protein
MPDAKRYAQEKEWRAFDARLQTSEVTRSDEPERSLNEDLIVHLKYARAEDGRRAAAYSQASNAKRQAGAVVSLAQFSAKFEVLLRTSKSSRQIARILIERNEETRSVEAIATAVQNARKYLKRGL